MEILKKKLKENEKRNPYQKCREKILHIVINCLKANIPFKTVEKSSLVFLIQSLPESTEKTPKN